MRKVLASAFLAASLLPASVAHSAGVTIDALGAGQFLVPGGVMSLDLLLVGGGGGGANGHQGGGGAGDVFVTTVVVTPGAMINYHVGAGGNGAISQDGNNSIVGLTPGEATQFGMQLANGGGVVAGVNQGGQNGSSGGGAACNAGSLGGTGGSGGSNGQACQSGASMPIGLGAGDYTGLLALFTENVMTAGAGGAGGTGSNAGGGGAGGIQIDGLGPVAGNGAAAFSALGGIGYGAGGGAGGLDLAIDGVRYAGGNGAGGVIYIQYDGGDPVPIPLPAGLPLVLTGLGALAVFRRRTR